MRPLVLAALLALALAARAEDALPADPHLVRGRLENGMEYWIRPQAVPAGKASLLLHVGSGSLNETDEQRGVAHFLEHMAFNGSEHFKPGEVVKLFESLGLDFGRHQNAFTSFDQTCYFLHLPDTTRDTMDRAFLFLSDVARGLTLSEEEVDKERPVVLEELRARSGEQQRTMEKLLPHLAPGSLVAERIPIGLVETIRTAGREQLADYYRKWYRPDLTRILVCGDVQPDEMVARIRATFAGWKAPENAPDPAAATIEPYDSLRAVVVTDPDRKSADVTMYCVLDAPPRTTKADLRRAFTETMATHVLNRRFQRLVQKGGAPYHGAGSGVTLFVARVRASTLSASGETAHWPAMLRSLVVEAKRAREHGPRKDEVDDARAAVLADVEAAARMEASVPSSRMILRMNEELATGTTPMAPSQILELAREILPSIQADDLRGVYRAAFDPARALVVVALPEGADAPAEDSVLEAVRAAAAEETAAPGGPARRGPEVGTPEPGGVARRETHEASGVTALVLENGVRAFVKPMKERPERVAVFVNAHGGVCEETERNRGITELGILPFQAGHAATKTLDAGAIVDFFSDKKVNLGVSVSDAGVTFTLSGVREDVEDGLRVLHLFLKEPLVTEAGFEAARNIFLQHLDEFATNVPAQTSLRVSALLSGGDVRARRPAREEVAARTLDEVRAWLQRLVEEAPIAVSVAGDVEAEEAVRWVRTYFGSLQKRPDRFGEVRDRLRVSRGDGPFRDRVEVETPTPVGVAILGWRGVGRGDRPAQVALSHAGMVGSARMHDVIREEEGLTYSAAVGYQSVDYEGLHRLSASFTADPARVAEAAAKARGVLQGLVKEPPTPEELSAVEKQIRHELSQRMEEPGFWGSILAGLTLDEMTLDGMLAYLEDMQTVEAEPIRDALAAVAKDERYFEVVGVPAE